MMLEILEILEILALDNSTSFKYKASLLGKATDADGNHRSLKSTKIVAQLKDLSNFFRSLEMPLLNCKIHLQLNWDNNCVMYGPDTYAGGDNANRETTFKVTSTKLYVPIVTLSTEDNVNLTKQLNEEFKRSLYWNECKSKMVNRLFVLPFDSTNMELIELKEIVIENTSFQELKFLNIMS